MLSDWLCRIVTVTITHILAATCINASLSPYPLSCSTNTATLSASYTAKHSPPLIY